MCRGQKERSESLEGTHRAGGGGGVSRANRILDLEANRAEGTLKPKFRDYQGEENPDPHIHELTALKGQ